MKIGFLARLCSPRKSMLFLSALLVAGNVAIAQAEVEDKKFGESVEKYLLSDNGQKTLNSAMQKLMESRQKEQRMESEKREAAALESQFKNPIKVDIGNSPVMGPSNARITIVEFSDFQCPFCKRGKETIDAVIKAYPKDVKVAFKNLPLPMHPEALPAAKAATAAGKQGKFWEMHNAFFDKQSDLGESFYLEQAKTLGLNVDKFKADMNSPEVAKAVEEDMNLGKSLQINGTPAFFINGVAVRGAYPFDHFKKIIDRWMSENPAKG